MPVSRGMIPKRRRFFILSPPDPVKARKWAAALRAAAIPCRLRDHEETGRVQILVPTDRIDAATAELAAYETDNCDWPPPPPGREPGRRRPSAAASRPLTECLPVVLVGLILPVWHALLIIQNRHEAFVRLGAAARSSIVEQGQLWRLATALTLHADGSHVVSNSLWGILLGCALALQAGAGGTLLLGLLTGLGGNLMATMAGEDPRSAIGASTAVLGLVGLLAGMRFLQHVFDFSACPARPMFSRKAWLALIAGLALFGMLGSAPHTDLLGHLAGFLCGLLLAPAAWLCARRKASDPGQMTMLTGFILLLAGSWLWAISRL